MPTASIDCSQAKDILNSDGQLLPHQDNLISTPLGLTILEIQGELNLPTHVPNVAITESNREYIENFIKVDEIYDAVKFGRLEIDADETKVTLFIGKSQRLIGNIVKLDHPLAVLRVPVKTDDMTDDDEKIRLVDIVKKKMIFKQRPLPIM
ncbi:uncharacterized protein SPAPADRAFT_50681 [Spathaspora passalidarum NRRL Y-27907]|uniref:Chromosome transmission fidelity protein 8 n=1 Tax=Spathaspora passalidarum (strain NRRL Y-27907 / 11-Y1) TaxID=619300 RepID=G3APB0_SPAPN|nr:uncharacterized protein SPAPADRAFT_50681 [Spathaspora passalidarum NRRL Y-27907]EGW32087.1 hypothetical protein SPAPADRAFT_50681 [Spathaspora passalidarum NRRL Y-27907]